MDSERLYGGVTAADRQAERRGRIVRAGLEMFGERGLKSTRVKDVCEAAGLGPRYFYESFPNMEALFDEVFQHAVEAVSAEVAAEVDGAVREPLRMMRAGIGGLVRALSADPNRMRVLLIEPMTAGSGFDQRWHGFVAVAAAQIGAWLPTGDGVDARTDLDVSLTATALAGASAEILISWANGRTSATLDQIADYLTQLYVAAASIQPQVETRKGGGRRAR